MPAKSKTSIFDIEPSQEINPIPLRELRLRDIFCMTPIETLKTLVHYGLLRDGSENHPDRDYAIACHTCPGLPPMTLVASKDRSDGWIWRCPKCKKREKSIRDDSIFASSKLDIVNCLALLYMWCHDYDNHHARHELRLSEPTVVSEYARFRAVCVEANYRAPKIGGPGKTVEFDQTFLVHQKHHRGRPKPGTTVCYAVGVERDDGGRCFAVSVESCQIPDLDFILRHYIADGTTLMTDAHRSTLFS